MLNVQIALAAMASFTTMLDGTTGEKKIVVPILSIGELRSYTIPSFSVITVELREIKYQCQLPDKSVKVVDGFIREHPSLLRTYPTEASVKIGSQNACIVEVSDFHDTCKSY